MVEEIEISRMNGPSRSLLRMGNELDVDPGK